MVLCDDVPELRVLLRFALQEDPRVVIVGEASDGVEGVARVTELNPDVIVLDLSMPGLDGLEAIGRIRSVSPETAIVVFSGFSASRMSIRAMERGADRYLEKGESMETVRDAVIAVVSERRVA